MGRRFLAKFLLTVFVCGQLMISATGATSGEPRSLNGSWVLLDNPSEGVDLGPLAANSPPVGLTGPGRKVIFFSDERLMAAKTVSNSFATGPPSL